MNNERFNWLSATLHLPPPVLEAASNWLFELGAQAIWEAPPDNLGRVILLGGFVPEDRERLTAAWPLQRVKLAQAFGRCETDFDFSLQLEADQDWTEKWKEGLEPVSVEDRLIVAPTWWPEDAWPAKTPVLRLDPGLAFGSGHHASTWLALKALLDLRPLSGRILDVGAGSGILALAAALCGEPEAEIIGVDNDPDTVEVARLNAFANGLADRVDFSARPLAALNPSFTCLMANITQNILLESAPAIRRLAETGTSLVLSGLLREQAPSVLEAYAALGWRPRRRLDREEWTALVLEFR